MTRTALAAAILLLWVSSAPAGYLNNQLNQAWVSFRDLTLPEYSANATAYRKAGYRLTDIDIYPNGSGRLYSQIWEKNTDKRGWAEYRDLTSAAYAERWQGLGSIGYRPHDFESYPSGSTQLYAGIWVRNTENLSWSSKRDMTSAQYTTYFNEQRAAGRRPVDIDVYQTAGGLRYAAIWYQNVGNVAWTELRGMTRATYQAQLDAKSAAGYRVIDFESYLVGATQYYAAIWEKNPVGRSYQLRSDLTELQFSNLWRQYRDEGYRPVEFQRYPTTAGNRYAGLWVENDFRFDYARKGALDTVISNYRVTTKVNGVSLQGISVAVIRNGQMIYRRGFGYADLNDLKVAHGETIYNIASVAKVIGGTLAGKLEAEQRLRDGTTFTLNMRLPTRTYLSRIPIGPFGGAPYVTIPAHHTHNVDQLLSHLGCIGQYDKTNPPVPNQTTHYTSAVTAVRSIWGIGLVQTGPGITTPPCVVGGTVSYSSAAFTFVSAVLERRTGHTVSRLLREEIAVPYALRTLRSQFESTTLPANYDRASPYSDTNQEITYEDNSWKILSGGMEISAVDLALFGWKVLNGEIVSAAVRDNRLWAAVSPNCNANTGGLCAYGLGWGRGFIGPRRVVRHSGSWNGAASHILVYRDEGLVIAILSNRREHDPAGLAAAIGCRVLEVNIRSCPTPPPTNVINP